MINFFLNKTFFAQRENIELSDFYTTIFIFAVIPFVLLALSGLSFFSSKILMEKEGRRVRNLFISLIGVASIALLVLSAYMYLDNSYTVLGEIIYYTIFGLFVYFMGLFTASAIYAWLCAIIPPFYKPDYIIVLGSGLIGDKVPPLLASRLDKAVSYYKKWGREPLFITSGGQGSDELMSEAAAMKNYIVEKHGIADSNIIVEDKSTTTYENMLFSKRIIDKHKPNSKGIFVTNNFHVYRASMYASKVKLRATGVGSKTAFYYVPNAFTREFIGILEMKIWTHLFIIALYILSMIMVGSSYI